MNRLGPLLRPILVGRDDLLELADRRLSEVAAGRGQLLLLAGEAGIGKTRFVGAIARKAEGRGFLLSDGAVSPPDREVPASILLDMARTMLCEHILSKHGATRRAEIAAWVAGVAPSANRPSGPETVVAGHR